MSIKRVNRIGQSLVEVLVSIAVGAIVIGSATTAIIIALRSSSQATSYRVASLLMQDMMDNVNSAARGDWHNIYALPNKTGPNYVILGEAFPLAVNGTEGILESDIFSGLVGYWKFDEASGTTAYDSSGNLNNGTLTNNPTRTAAANCKVSACLTFDGVNGYVNVPVPHANFPTTAITVSTWVKLSTHINWNDFVHNNWGLAGSWLLFTNASGYTIFGLRDNALAQFNAQCPSALSLNEWHLLTGTYDGTTVKVYVDGVECPTTATLSGQVLYTAGAIRFGETSAGGASHVMDEVRLYNRALSATEISQLYASRVFLRSFSVENVLRDDLGGIITGAGTEDPSTQKITGSVTWTGGSVFTAWEYVTRFNNKVETITDWSSSSSYSEINSVDTTTTPGSIILP